MNFDEWWKFIGYIDTPKNYLDFKKACYKSWLVSRESLTIELSKNYQKPKLSDEQKNQDTYTLLRQHIRSK